MKLSLIITAKSKDDPKLHSLLSSIDAQIFPKDEVETLVITEGTSESAKAIGIKRAKGEIVGILASDNYLNNTLTLSSVVRALSVKEIVGCYPVHYYYQTSDNPLNRYFSIIGANDPLALYLGKTDRRKIFDRRTEVRYFRKSIPTLGDNGFFIRRDIILKADLEHYYHIDVCEDLRKLGYYIYAELPLSIWHKTGDSSIINFLRRRARFGAQHAFNRDRRWHLVSPKDALRLCWFVISSSTLVYPTIQSIIWYMKTKDSAVFLHPLICLGILFTYALVMIRTLFARLASLFVPIRERV